MNQDEQQLLDLYRCLDAGDAKTLRSFAEFLARREKSAEAPSVEGAPTGNNDADTHPPVIIQPASIPRPHEETVIAALKRLSQTYPMVDKSKVLNDTSSLVAAHVMSGRSAVEVINEFETIFRRHYDEYVDENATGAGTT